MHDCVICFDREEGISIQIFKILIIIQSRIGGKLNLFLCFNSIMCMYICMYMSMNVRMCIQVAQQINELACGFSLSLCFLGRVIMQLLPRKYSPHVSKQYCVLQVVGRRRPQMSRASLMSSIPKEFGLFQFGSLAHSVIWR